MTESHARIVTVDDIMTVAQTEDVTGELGQNTLIGQSAQDIISIPAPSTGEVRLITVNQGETLDLQFDPTLANPNVLENDFILNFDNNADGISDSQLIFRNLVSQATADNSPTLIIGGIEIPANLLISQALALSEEGTTLETAAGTDRDTTGGGNSQYSDNLGNIIDLLIAQGVIDPTELTFGLFNSIDENTDPARGSFSLSFNTPGFKVAGGFEDTLPSQHLVGGDIGFDDNPFTPGETEAAPLQLLFNFVPEDNEFLQSVSIDDLPPGVTLFIGGFDPVNQVLGPFPVVITPENFDKVYLLPPVDSDEDFIVSGSATIFDPNTNQVSILAFAEEAIIDAVADVPEMDLKIGQNGPIVQAEEKTIILRLEASLRDLDGSESLSLEISGVPEDFTALGGLPNGWDLVPSPPNNGFITYSVIYTGNGPAPMDISGAVTFATNDYTTHKASPGAGRNADGTPNEDGPLHIVVSAIATELEADLGTDELLLENNIAIASETVTFHLNEDVPTIEKIIKVWVDETSGDQSGAEIHVTNNVVGVSDAIEIVDSALAADGLIIDRDNALTQGFVKRNAAVNLYSDGKDDELNFSDVNPDNNNDQNGPQNDTDDQEIIKFISYSGTPAVSDGPANHMHTTGGEPIYLYSSSENPDVVYGVFGDNADNNLNGSTVAFIAYITSDLNNGLNAIEVYLEQLVPLEHPNPMIDFEHILLDLKFVVVDDEGDVSDPGTLSLYFADDGPFIEIKNNEELINNGSFENNPLDGNGWDLFDNIEGWNNGDGNSFEVQKGDIGGLAPKQGNSKIELDGHNGPDSNATLQQTIDSTELGQDYLLTFWYAPRPNDGQSNSSSFKVIWAGEEVIVKDSSGVNEGWQKVSIVLSGTGEATDLTFIGTGQENTLGAYIDGVSLMAAHVVDEDDLPGGSDNDKESLTIYGDLGIDFGADEAGSIFLSDEQLTSLAELGLQSDGIDINEFVFDANSETLTAYTANDLPVFVIDFNSQDGTFSFTLLKALDHPNVPGENILSLSIPFTATDGDNDPVKDNVEIKVIDDAPAEIDDENNDAPQEVIMFSLYDSGELPAFDFELPKSGQAENKPVLIKTPEGQLLNGSTQDEIFIGGSSDDVINANAGNDTLTGNAGNDILSGGEGSDIFVFTTHDLGFNDTITDFSPNDGDILDLADLLDGAFLGNGLENNDLSALLNDYLDISYNGNDTLIIVDNDKFGEGSDTTASISLQDINLMNGFSDSQELVNSLLDNENLVVQ